MSTSPTAKRVLLFDGHDIVAYALETGGQQAVVAFQAGLVTPLGQADAATALGFGAGVFTKHGYDELHIIARTNNWYQTPEMGPVIAAAKTWLAGREGVTYGTSMGGYGAVAFSGPLGVPCVALTPQFSIDQRDVAFEKRWRAEAAEISFDNTLIGALPRATGHVFYDSAQPDERRHAALIAQNSDCQMIPCAYSGHSSPRHLNRTYGLRRLVLEILNGDFDRTAFMAARRPMRKHDGVYLCQLIRGLLDHKKRQTARAVFNKYATYDKFETRELFHMCKAFAQAKDRDIAQSIFDAAMTRGLPNPSSFYQLAGMSRALRDEDMFAALTKEAITKFPTNEKVAAFADRIRTDRLRPARNPT